ncbi:MAG: leucine-rich repeat domain-containing protein [Clostridia bacterium]|nr:leucine-rich repeat domain-containing protein [Clostridia bacterium]
MKKIFTAALCFVAAAAVLTGCTSKRYKPEETTKLPESPLMQVAGDVYEVPEEQKVFEVETDMYSASGGLKIVGYTGEAEELEIPAKLVHPALGECPVETIGEAAFLGNTTLKKVVIPEGVVEVKAGAFQSCSALTDVVLPEGLVAIGDSAFESTNLTNINIPSTVKTIGKLAFSTQLNPTPWYKAQTAEKVIVGDGILLKYNGKGDVTFGDEVKSVAYYAFQSPGAINVRFNSDLESFDSFAVYETASSEEQEDRKYPITFLVPYKSNAQKLISTLPVHCSVHSIPVFDNNPFKWDFNNAKEMTDSWTAGQLDMTFAGEGAMRGVITSNDPRINCTDILNLPAENFKTLKIRMKHDIVEAKTPANEGQFVFQIFYNNGTGLSEAASVKHSIDQSSNGEYIDYAIDMSGEMWTDIIKGFRIDITDRLTGEFLIDSIEFVADSEAFDYNTLLKPVTKYVPKVEDTTHKYKFEDEAKALAWTMAGFEYSYAPISVAEEAQKKHLLTTASMVFLMLRLKAQLLLL